MFKIVTRDSSGHYSHVSGNTPLSALNALGTQAQSANAVEEIDGEIVRRGIIMRDGRTAWFADKAVYDDQPR
jgi:hypothetical protein